MCKKVIENFVVSLTKSDRIVNKVAVCYQSKKSIAEKIASLLPYETIVIDSINETLSAEVLCEITHAIEFYEPYGEGYGICKSLRKEMQAKEICIVDCYDWQESYLNDSFWGDVDYEKLSAEMKQIAKDVEKVETFHITSELGTDIRFSTKGRRWIAATGITRTDELSQMPDGEIYTCPIEDTFTGTLVVDGTVTRSWLPDKPQKLKFEKGYLVECSDELKAYIEPMGKDIYLIGEFALSFNPAHRDIVKNISVDEKAAGTVHFALGDSYNIGKNHANCHVDMVIRAPIVKTEPYVELPYFNKK